MLSDKISLALCFLILFIIIPASFATDELSDNLTIDEINSTLSINNDEDILTTSNDYYFNASLEDDNGDGSISNPYKYLTADRIKSNANIYLTDGEYILDTSKMIDQVNIIGSDTSKTVIKYDGVAFNVNHYLTLTNVTLLDLSITNSGIVNFTNTIFDRGYGSNPDSYGNNYGGAIYTTDTNRNSQVNIVNSTFKNNYAVYGGAVYMGAGYLNIADSEFINNLAYNYGGAIACENIVNINISKSKFIKNIALNDAGGAIYIKHAKNFNADSIFISNSTATFGGAITTLDAHVSLRDINASNNSAEWDGGAIYHMYGTFASNNGYFVNNSARNGGALFIDNSTSLNVIGNTFINNTASAYAGAIYSILNHLESATTLRLVNTFINNSAEFDNEVYETDFINLTIGNGNYTLYVINETIINDIPSYYSMVQEGYITPVKDQQTSGNCWAFTAMAVLESCIKKATGIELDLSEENMKNVIALFSDYGWDIETNNGGYDYMPWAYLTSWLGPVFESDDYFDDKSVLSPLLESVSHIQNILFLKRDNFTDNDDIKTAILKYGAVGTSLYFDSYYLNNGVSYYCWNPSSNNHAVTIVGWDDNYSRDNFKFGAYVDGDGAWIVKNSWSPNWGDDGYFYVSYYDESFAKTGLDASSYTFILNDTVRFDKNYQYDIAGMTDYLYASNSKVWYKNKFTATNNEILKGVSTYFEKLTNWTVSVYVNNVLKSTKSGTSNPGYYTINLDDLILLTIGDTFEVVFNTTSDDISRVPVSEYHSLNKLIYSENVSFISFDGETWSDLFNYSRTYSLHSYKSQVACIKAFTVLIDFNTTLSLEVNNNYNPITVTATVKDQYGKLVNSGAVTFIINGQNTTVNVANGKASITCDFNEGIQEVFAIFRGISYISSSNSTSFEVSKENITLNVIISKYQNNITLTITSSKNISKKVLILVNGQEYTVRLVNGRASFKLTNLENGKYDINVSLYENNAYNSNVVNLSAIINVKNTQLLVSDFITTDYSGDSYTVVLVDEDGNPIANKKITFHLNNDKINNFTDSNGKVSIVINLDSGDYAVAVDFNDEDEYYGCSNSSEIKVKTKVDVTLENETYQNNVLINVSISKPINASLTVSVNCNNQTVNVINGIGAFNLTNLENGNYTIAAYLDDSYQYSSNILEININVRNTDILAQNLVTSDENVNYTITLIDEDGNPLENKEIGFRLNNVSYYATTDDGGNASITLPLLKGLNSIGISFKGDKNFFKTNSSGQITYKPRITAIIIVANMVDLFFIEAQFSRPINQTAIICLDGVNTTVNIINGQGVISKSGLENGIHNVSVELLGDEYDFNKTSTNFTVLIKKTQILAGDFITEEHSRDNYTVTLIDEDGIPISNERIMLVLDKIYLVFTNETGQASIPIDLSYGNYSITSKFDPSLDTINDYFGCEIKSKIIVKINASANVEVTRDLRDVKVNISFTKAINETINVSINGENRSVNITDGNTILNLNNLENGNYTIRFNLDENKYFSSPPVECNFTVNVKGTQIIANDFETYWGSGDCYKVQLTDQDGLPVKSALISLTFDGVETNIVRTNDEGIALIPIKLDNGHHNLLIKFKGDNDFISSQGMANINVNPSIVFSNNQYTLNSEYIASLTGNVSGKQVDVSIDGVLYKVIAKDGRISLNINLNVGSHVITVTNPVTGEVQSQTIKILPRLGDNKNIMTYYGANKLYSVKVYGDDGKIVGANEVVLFKIDGTSYNIKTNKNGIASIKLNKFAAKTYDVTVTYKGYKVSNKITIKPTLITKNKSAKKGKTVKFTAKLLNTNGKALKGKKITFKIKNKKYTAKTNKKGKATIKIKNLKAGKYKITSKYAKLQNINTIKIKK